jgi:hypothetical protein
MKGTYTKSEHFEIIDTIGVPHRYTIGANHVAYAADHHNGMLSEDAIRQAESLGKARCEHPRCQLSYDQHEHALVVACRADLQTADGSPNPELQQFLLDNKAECEANSYAGFAFVDKRP